MKKLIFILVVSALFLVGWSAAGSHGMMPMHKHHGQHMMHMDGKVNHMNVEKMDNHPMMKMHERHMENGMPCHKAQAAN